jgi:hypothetical protein
MKTCMVTSVKVRISWELLCLYGCISQRRALSKGIEQSDSHA